MSQAVRATRSKKIILRKQLQDWFKERIQQSHHIYD